MEGMIVNGVIPMSREGTVKIPPEVLEAAGIRPGDAVVLYQMGDEIHMQRDDGTRSKEAGRRA